MQGRVGRCTVASCNGRCNRLLPRGEKKVQFKSKINSNQFKWFDFFLCIGSVVILFVKKLIGLIQLHFGLIRIGFLCLHSYVLVF